MLHKNPSWSIDISFYPTRVHLFYVLYFSTCIAPYEYDTLLTHPSIYPRHLLQLLFVIPAQVVIYYVVYQKKFSFESICSLFVLLFGVYLSTEPEMSNKWTGFVLGTSAAVIVVPLQTVYVAEKCREYKWSSIECNFQTTPFVSFFSLLLAFFIESKGVQSTCVILMADGMLPIFLMWIGLSCLCAVGVNILTIAISRRSSAISYSVLGHVKTIGVITVSVLRGGNERPSLQILAGLICAMSGSWFYSAAEGKRIKVE